MLVQTLQAFDRIAMEGTPASPCFIAIMGSNKSSRAPWRRSTWPGCVQTVIRCEAAVGCQEGIDKTSYFLVARC